MPRINLAGVKTTFEAIPEGRYPAVFTGFKNKTNKNRDLMIVAEFTLKDDEYSGQKAWNNFNIDETGTRYFKLFLIAMGASEEVVEGDFDSDEILPAFIGDPCELVIGPPSTYNGQERTNILRIEAA